jgi:CO/xanthine dehydrogenase FAD-binding subunit
VPYEPPVSTPLTLAEAFALLAGAPEDAPLRPVAGATDLLVQITGEIGSLPPACLDLWRLDELRGIAVQPAADGSDEGGSLVLGALTTFAEIRRSALCRELVPALVEAAATVGAAQIQNRATIGGNIANASPAGDSLPVLLATDAIIDVGGPRGERSVDADAFWPAYRTTALAPDELVLRVRLPLAPGRETRYRKVGTRRAQAISKVVMALAWRDEAAASHLGPRVWREVRLALGSVAATPIRARATERILEGSRPTPETADRAADTLATEISPIEDVRSTAEYRRAVAARVLHRLIREEGGW